MRDVLATFVFMFETASALDGLNEEQRQAATDDGGPLLILAGGWHREDAHTGRPRGLAV